MENLSTPEFDCILIPGGGLLEDGNLPPWTITRLDLALKYRDQCRWFILLSGGTVHKPPPLSESGFPIFESRQAAEYLISAGLDPKQIIEIRELVKSLAGDQTIILSTHILPEVTMICQRCLIIDRGRIVADDSLEALTAQGSLESVFLKLTTEDVQ